MYKCSRMLLPIADLVFLTLLAAYTALRFITPEQGARKNQRLHVQPVNAFKMRFCPHSQSSKLQIQFSSCSGVCTRPWGLPMIERAFQFPCFLKDSFSSLDAAAAGFGNTSVLSVMFLFPVCEGIAQTGEMSGQDVFFKGHCW